MMAERRRANRKTKKKSDRKRKRQTEKKRERGQGSVFMVPARRKCQWS